ncbi:MAG: PDZ domain-containing protein [Propionibacteriaceae bacterium]|jgi:PDZ domain-containing protein|nr:PDZ domain-containing protein [Propionibacteriaceae bacterium]
MRQSRRWTAGVSAALFVTSAALVAMLPVPYVTYSPRPSVDLLAADSPISIAGAQVYDATGELRMTLVSRTPFDAQLSLPEVLAAYWLPDREALPREGVYAAGTNALEVEERDTRGMAAAQSDAVVAGLRAAGIPVQQYPMVTAVAASGAAVDKLKPGDLILRVNTTPVADAAAIAAELEKHNVGDTVMVSILRDGEETAEVITTRATTAKPNTPVLGVTLDLGYSYTPQVTFAEPEQVAGGSSAGLVYALAIYDLLTENDLVAGRVIAGSGTIDANGAVGTVSAVREKIAGAAADGASVFLIPKGNCVDAQDTAGITLVAVESLSEAISALNALAAGSGAPGCQ